MTVLHNHRVVSGQSVRDAVLTFTVHRLKDNRQTVTEQIKYPALENTRSQTTTNASFRVQKAQLFTIFTRVCQVRVTVQCVRDSPETTLLKKNVLYRKIIKTKLLCSNCFRCYICFTLNISCIIPQKKKNKDLCQEFPAKEHKERSHTPVTVTINWPELTRARLPAGVFQSVRCRREL